MVTARYFAAGFFGAATLSCAPVLSQSKSAREAAPVPTVQRFPGLAVVHVVSSARYVSLRLALQMALPVAVLLMGTAESPAQDEEMNHQQHADVEDQKEVESPYKLLRAEEDFTYLRDDSPREIDFFDAIKFIPLNESQSAFLTVGGEVRARLELFENPEWEKGRDDFYSQRLALHTSLRLGPHVRVFGEIYHGLLGKEEKEFTQDDKLDLHQGFVQLSFPAGPSHQVELRVGRQELSYGSARLVGLREGPNIRRAFDSARVLYDGPRLSVEGGVGREVLVPFGYFDNRRNEDMFIWHVFATVPLPLLPGGTEVYYFGLDSKESRFNDGVAPETRHTIGARRFGTLGPSFFYNTEAMFQFGAFGDKRIRAFALETDYHYRLEQLRFRPELGIKLDYISGDRNQGDERLETFNPMFPNPSYFGLLGQITPMNLFDVHPSVMLELASSVELLLDWDFFWRASKEDGLYGPPRFLIREGHEAESRHIGHQPGAELVFRIGRHITWSSEVSYFVAGDFIQETGESENIFHFASTLSYRF